MRADANIIITPYRRSIVKYLNLHSIESGVDAGMNREVLVLVVQFCFVSFDGAL